MKTQINNLVKGNHVKGIVGTSHNERMEIANKVIAENHNSLTLRIRSHEVTLRANWSKSGLSVSYFGGIPVELYTSIVGNFALPQNTPEAFIQVQGDMEVWFFTNSKKSYYQIIDNKEIEIL